MKWLIKVTRSDVSEVADNLLRHEKAVYSRLLGDLERRAIEACAPLPPPVVPGEVGVIFKNH